MMTSNNRIFRWLALVLVLGLASLLASAPASAQARTWVSGVGDDANSCARTAPCKTFAGAISKTSASGEINCLDPGGFGTVIITKAITLNCSGLGNGGVSAVSGSGITINAGASDVVIIDGLDIDGAGAAGLIGINFIAGDSLIVRNTVIRNFAHSGIEFSPAANATLTVDNTSIINVGNIGGYGAINIRPTSAAAVRANVSRSQFSNDSFGVAAHGANTTGSVFVALRDTSITNSGQSGVYTNNGTALFSTVSLDGVTVAGSGDYGLLATGARAGMLVNNSSINNNISGGVAPLGGGVIYSYGNNRVNGNNGNDGTFTGILSTH